MNHVHNKTGRRLMGGIVFASLLALAGCGMSYCDHEAIAGDASTLQDLDTATAFVQSTAGGFCHQKTELAAECVINGITIELEHVPEGTELSGPGVAIAMPVNIAATPAGTEIATALFRGFGLKGMFKKVDGRLIMQGDGISALIIQGSGILIFRTK